MQQQSCSVAAAAIGQAMWLAQGRLCVWILQKLPPSVHQQPPGILLLTCVRLIA